MAVLDQHGFSAMLATVEATPLREVIGANIRLFRGSLGFSQEQLARRLRDYGLPWDRSQIAKAERGDRDFTVPQLVLIAAALELSAVTLIEPPAGVSEVALGPEATITAELLTNVFSVSWEPPRGGWPKGLKVPQRRDLDDIRRDAGLEAEQRAATVLGVTPEALARAARRLYGHSFGVERDERAYRLWLDGDNRSSRAVRGLVTAQLVEDLREEVQSEDGGSHE